MPLNSIFGYYEIGLPSRCVVSSISPPIEALARNFFRYWLNSLREGGAEIDFLLFYEGHTEAEWRDRLPDLGRMTHLRMVPVRPTSAHYLGPKFCVYSASEVHPAHNYLFIDMDTIVLDSQFLSLFNTMEREGVSALVTEEMSYQSLQTAMFEPGGFYNGAGSISVFSDYEGRPLLTPEVLGMLNRIALNTGVMFLSGWVLKQLHYVLMGPTRYRKWVELPSDGFAAHREQGAVNLALLHFFADYGSGAPPVLKVLEPTYNWQMNHNPLAVLYSADGHILSAISSAGPIRVMHFAGWKSQDNPSAVFLREHGMLPCGEIQC